MMEDTLDTDDMADKQQVDKKQINDSTLFTKLPPELRLKIYEEVFEGSKTTHKEELVVRQHTYHNILSPTNHRTFLLTCRQAYNEALETYWSQTILYGDPEYRDLVFFLRSAVPEFAKLRINHIRDLSQYRVEQLPVRECLEDFQFLQTISFSFRYYFNTTDLDMADRDIVPTIQEQAEDALSREVKWFNRLVYDGGPAVIRRAFFRRVVPVGSKLAHLRSKQDRTVSFYNYSTGKVFYPDDPDHINDEEAYFAMVLNNQAPAEDSGEKDLVDMARGMK